jgi:hypothetical protein
MVQEQTTEEENALNRDLVQLTNQATLSQLNDMMSDEHEFYSSVNSRINDTLSEASADDKPKTATEDDDLDAIVRSNLIRNQWDVVESRQSMLDAQNNERSPRVNAEPGWKSMEVQEVEEAVEPTQQKTALEAVPSSDEVLDHDGDLAAFNFLAKKRDHVPLPSFEDDDVKDVDVDDISCNDDSRSFQSEIRFNSTWQSGGLLFDGNVSAYDNLGEKRVGRDVENPVYMFIPKSESVTKIGDQ